MRIIKVSILILIALLLSLSFASAVDISEFNPPKGFDEGFGKSMDYDDYSIVIEDYDTDLDKDLFKGDNFNHVTVKGKMAEFNDTFHDEVGAMELIKIGKEHHIVKCKYDGDNASKISDCTKYLKEFNKKNNLNPEKIKYE